jgi:hypothetical protein
MKPLNNQNQTYQKPSTEAQKTINNQEVDDIQDKIADELINALNSYTKKQGY